LTLMRFIGTASPSFFTIQRAYEENLLSHNM